MFTVKNISADELQKFYHNFKGERTFLQSQNFVDYRQKCGEEILLEGYFKDSELVAVALIQKLETRLKSWLHVPHGPLVQKKIEVEFWPWWLEHYQALGKQMNLDLVRFSSLLSDDTSLEYRDFKPAATHLVNPEKTWILDITKPEDELLGQMKKSTRYEVRKGLKPETGFKITVDKNLDAFWELHEATVARQGFVPFTRKSTEQELEAFGNNSAIITVWHEEKALASGVFLFDDRAGYYHQGASVFSKLPAAHAYIWAAIVEAKKRGCTEFNFWGVCGEDDKKHPWFGLSKFKRGFGGQEKNYLHVQDCELTWKAKLNRIIEGRRKKKRGY